MIKAKHFQYVTDIPKFLNQHMVEFVGVVSADIYGEGCTVLYREISGIEIITELRSKIDQAILCTPSGKDRDLLTSLNIILLEHEKSA